jgi:hypothetical protein
MNTFSCHCGNTLHFENTLCLACGRQVGFLPDENTASALEPLEDARYLALANDRGYRKCRNYHEYNVCNWMVGDDEPGDYCQSCRLTEIIPDLTERGNLKLWFRIEKAKRRLLYTLKQLRLPIHGRDRDPEHGLSFRFLAEATSFSEFNDEPLPGAHVMTGHLAGTITINLAEADASTREETREKMNERYRTLLGHFRHESGHFYWEKLVNDTGWLDPCRKLFGDERQNYQGALESYYNQGAATGWEQQWISAYASAHPWEDFAETWAHYLHMIDTLETAHDFGFSVRGQGARRDSTPAQLTSGYFTGISLDTLLEDWFHLTTALNAMNRSMGLPDVYPFVLSELVTDKLEFIHRLILDNRG